MAKEKEKKEGPKLVAQNRKARFNYELFERFEAGLVLKGSEVKSIRAGKVSLNESYAAIRDGAFFVINMDIQPYSNAGYASHEPKRPRKLLLHREQIKKLTGKTKEKGLTLVPVSLYFKKGKAKLEVALARGKQKGDKRDKLTKQASDKDLRKRALRY